MGNPCPCPASAGRIAKKSNISDKATRLHPIHVILKIRELAERQKRQGQSSFCDSRILTFSGLA